MLRTMRLGEADRIVTLVTPEHGKVRAVAKGIRKPKSRFSGRLEPLTHVNVMCWRGRELDVVNQVEALDHFKAIRADLERVPVAQTMLEVVDHVALERQPMPEVFRMLVGALRTLDERAAPALLVRSSGSSSRWRESARRSTSAPGAARKASWSRSTRAKAGSSAVPAAGAKPSARIR